MYLRKLLPIPVVAEVTIAGGDVLDQKLKSKESHASESSKMYKHLTY